MSGWRAKFGALFGSAPERQLRTYHNRAAAIGKLAADIAALDDGKLRARFDALRTRRQNGDTADALMNETFAVVREAAQRQLAMRHFDVQLVGGMALFDGKIAEMKTGEGKTLVATLAVCLEALAGSGVHVVTVNDYLARRDAEWMGRLYAFLGLSVGVNVPGLDETQKRAVYASDIVYGTNNEFGFDYLRHNMRYTPAGIQQTLNFAIVDEVDSILIDEARTPLIISGESNESVELYSHIAKIAVNFERCESEDAPGDFLLDEKSRTVQLSESGFERAEKLFATAGLIGEGDSLYESAHLPLLHHLDVALRARHLFVRDKDYVVQDGKVIIVDEFTGRLMHGRRWGDNQHQAVEAKEGLAVQKESQTLASISFQNYFRLYKKLAGMTGTAKTEAEEFEFIYGLQTVAIPSHQPMVRDDGLDKVYRTLAGKHRAIMEDITDSHKRGQPVLVGTTSIEASERLSAMLTKESIPHNVLNAKNHESEAGVIAQAGLSKAITIATNMAGRGTDIVLGGNIIAQKENITADEQLSDAQKQQQCDALQSEWQSAHEQVVAAGGLRVIGTERHESRRIDNQLRGRSGRQGDPGSSIFYLSFDDALLRIFATRHVSALMEKLKLDEDEAIEANMVSRVIENAQRKVESHNFDVRRQLLDYDDIANDQRHIIYNQREEILQAEDIAAVARQFRIEHLNALMDTYIPADEPEEQWRAAELRGILEKEYHLPTPVDEWIAAEDKQPRDYFVQKLTDTAEAHFAEKLKDTDATQLAQFMRSLILNIIDDHWRGHLSALDSLRQSIAFRGMAQKNPKQEYKRESFALFEQLLQTVQKNIARVLFALRIKSAEEVPPPPPPPVLPGLRPPPPEAGIGTAAGNENMTVRTTAPEGKVRRNAPCPCGSGKKYKHCCGKI